MIIEINSKYVKIPDKYKAVFSQCCDGVAEIKTIDDEVEITFTPLYTYSIGAYNSNEIIYCSEIDSSGDISVSNDYVQCGCGDGKGEISIRLELDSSYYEHDFEEYDYEDEDYDDSDDFYIEDDELIKIASLLIEEVVDSLENSEDGIATFNYILSQGWLDEN